MTNLKPIRPGAPTRIQDAVNDGKVSQQIAPLKLSKKPNKINVKQVQGESFDYICENGEFL